jgi:hypothetical protein
MTETAAHPDQPAGVHEATMRATDANDARNRRPHQTLLQPPGGPAGQRQQDGLRSAGLAVRFGTRQFCKRLFLFVGHCRR